MNALYAPKKLVNFYNYDHFTSLTIILTIFFALEMLSAFYICCIYSSALQTRQECSLKDSYNPQRHVDSHLCVTFCCRRNGMAEGLVLHTSHSDKHLITVQWNFFKGS